MPQCLQRKGQMRVFLHGCVFFKELHGTQVKRKSGCTEKPRNTGNNIPQWWVVYILDTLAFILQ